MLSSGCSVTLKFPSQLFNINKHLQINSSSLTTQHQIITIVNCPKGLTWIVLNDYEHALFIVPEHNENEMIMIDFNNKTWYCSSSIDHDSHFNQNHHNPNSNDLAANAGSAAAIPYNQLEVVHWEYLTNHINIAGLNRIMDNHIEVVHFLRWDDLVFSNKSLQNSNDENTVQNESDGTNKNLTCSSSETHSQERTLQRDRVINWTAFDYKKSYPTDEDMVNITTSQKVNTISNLKSKYSMDKSYLLNKLLTEKTPPSLFLSELQFSFLFFYIGQFQEGLEHWKMLVALVCHCEEALIERESFFMEFINTLENQLVECPADLFMDPLSNQNFLVDCLSTLYSNVMNLSFMAKNNFHVGGTTDSNRSSFLVTSEDSTTIAQSSSLALKSENTRNTKFLCTIMKTLKIRIQELREFLLDHFQWDMDMEDPENMPVVVEM